MNTSLIKRASSNDASPTPGYLYKEIAEMTQISYEVSESVCNFLFKRLEHNSPHVKLKVLKIIKNTAVMGHSDFKKLASRRSEDIRKCSQFVGQKDPLHGDAFNESVRTAANEAFIAVFATSSSTNNQTINTHGFSNPNYEPSERETQSKSEVIWNKVSGIIPKSRKKEQHHFTHGAGGFEKFEQRRQAQFTNSGDSFEEKKLPNSNISIPGGFQIGGTGDQSTFVPPSLPNESRDLSPPSKYYKTNSNSNSRPSQKSYSQSNQISSPGSDSDSNSNSNSNPYSHEQRFVDEKTSPSGSHSVPSRSAVSTFCSRARNMDLLEISELLDEKLLSPKWQTRLKSLYFVEGLLQQKHDDVKSYFIDNADNLSQLSISSRLSVSKKAKSILRQIGKGDLIGSSSSVGSKTKNSSNSKSHAVKPATNSVEPVQNNQGKNNSSLIDFANSDDPSQLFAGLDITEGNKNKTHFNANEKTNNNNNNNFDPQNFWEKDNSQSTRSSHGTQQAESQHSSSLLDDLELTDEKDTLNHSNDTNINNNNNTSIDTENILEGNSSPSKHTSSANAPIDDIASFFDSDNTSMNLPSKSNTRDDYHQYNYAPGTSMRSKMNSTYPTAGMPANVIDPSLYQYPPQHHPPEGPMPPNPVGYHPPYHQPYPPTSTPYPQQYPYATDYSLDRNASSVPSAPSPNPRSKSNSSTAPSKSSIRYRSEKKKAKESEFSFLDDESDESDHENSPDNVLSEMLKEEFSRNKKK